MTTSPYFRQIQVEYFNLCRKNGILHHRIGWGTKTSFNSVVYSSVSLVWVDTNAMLIAWKARSKKNDPIGIPTKHIKFAKNNSSRINVSQIADESNESSEWFFYILDMI